MMINMKNGNYFSRHVLNIGALGLLLFIVSCGGDDDGPGVPGYRVAFSFDPANPQAGETVTFTDASTGGDSWLWDFGDGETSTSQNPKHIFTSDGTYLVTLQVDGHSSLTAEETVTVGKAVPVITVDPEVIEVGVTEVEFSAAIYNPDNGTLSYEWTLGDGVEFIGNENASSADPSVLFTSAGDRTVSVKITLDGEVYEASKDISVSEQLAKTLYFAVVNTQYANLNKTSGDGSVYSRKLTVGFNSESVNTNVPVADHPFTLRVRNDRVYVFDAGDGVTFTGASYDDSDATTGDGSISSFSVSDATDVITHLSFQIPTGFNYDPFTGDVAGGKIYWADRRNGIYSVDENTLNVTVGTADEALAYSFAKNNQLNYYNADPGYGWGAQNGGFHVRENGSTTEYWWSKCSNHRGVWRFEETDILEVFDGGALPVLGSLLESSSIRAFEIDEANGKMYYSVNVDDASAGIYQSNLDGSNVVLIDGSPFHEQGSNTERVHGTGIAIDAEAGFVYWSYTSPWSLDDLPDIDAGLDEADPLQASNGIKRWKLDGTGEVEYFLTVAEDEFIYGIAIDHTKR